MLIDSHHHLWAYDPSEYDWISDEMSVLRHDFLTPELSLLSQQHGVNGFVSVQARQSLVETEALLNMASDCDLIRGVVGWVPLADESILEVLANLRGRAALKGVRHVVQDEPDDDFLDGEAFNRGVAALGDFGLRYDLLIFARQLPAAIRFVDRHPDLPIVLDHIAKPTIQGDTLDAQWHRDFVELAKREHVTCKFSGVVTEVRDANWSIETIRPYWEVALEAFTTERLMFGSDWPVCLLRSQYGDWLSAVRTLASELSSEQQASFFAGNAIKFYGLEVNE